MSKEQAKDLKKILTPLPDEIQETALWLREFVWDLYPHAKTKINKKG